MEGKTKQHILVTVIGVALFVALWNYSVLLALVGQVVRLVMPVIAGGILALFLWVPMSSMEKGLERLFQNRKRRPSPKGLRVASFLLTWLCIALVLVLALTLLIPELVQSFQSLYRQVEVSLPRWMAYLNRPDTGLVWVREWVDGIDWEQWLHSLSDRIDGALASAVDAVSSTVNMAVTATFAFVISIYMTLGRESLCRHGRKLVEAYCKPRHGENILRFCQMFRQSFAHFLTGQCGEAVILGVLMAAAFGVFQIPYGSLVGVLTAVCAIIPYVGAFLSCAVSVFLVLLVDPLLALRCLVVYLAVQFVENQLIYPRVVGRSVGLPPLYTLVAAMVGGKLFGILGILFFIPLAAVVVELVKEDARKRLRRREQGQEGAAEEAQPR